MVGRERWAGARTGGSLEPGTLDVAGVRRSYWLARARASRGRAGRHLDATGILLDTVTVLA